MFWFCSTVTEFQLRTETMIIIKYTIPGSSTRLDLSTTVALLMKSARTRGTRHLKEYKANNHSCTVCSDPVVQAHHIVPLWAYALLYIIIKANSRTAYDLCKIMSDCEMKRIDFSEWHKGNLMSLCSECHQAIEIFTKKLLRKRFAQEFKISFFN